MATTSSRERVARHRARQRGEDVPLRKSGYAATTEPCAVPGCKRKYYASGFCHAHYMAWLRKGKPE